MDTNLACYLLKKDLKTVEQMESPLFGHLLENFVSIPPKSINAANKHTFQATGQGDVLQGAGSSWI